MRAMFMITAMAASMIACPAQADITDSPGDWYKIAVSNDGAETYYMDVDFAQSHTRAGFVGVGVLKTDVGPLAADGNFANYTFVDFSCSDRTWAISDHLTFDRTAKVTDKFFVNDADEKFRPVNENDPLFRAFQIACKELNPSTIPTTGSIMIAQLIAQDIAAYNTKGSQ